MEELWQQTSELLWQSPLLWLPVLVADLLGFLAALGSASLMRSVILNRLQYHSVLGGPAVPTQLSAATVHRANLIAALITLPADYLRLLLYALALVVTAAMVRACRQRETSAFADVLPALRRNGGAVLSLSLRALAIFGGVALLSSWLAESLVAHGHKAWFAGGWLDLGIAAIRTALLAWLLVPVAVQLLAGRAPTAKRRTTAQLFAFALGLVSLLLGRFTAENMRAVHIVSAPARYALELTASWIVALPYAVFFVALGLVIYKTSLESGEVPA